MSPRSNRSILNHVFFFQITAIPRTMITTVVNGLKMEYPIVYAHLRYDEIRSLPNESNTIKNGRLRPKRREHLENNLKRKKK